MFHSLVRFYVTQWSVTWFYGSLRVYSLPLPSEKKTPLGSPVSVAFLRFLLIIRSYGRAGESTTKKLILDSMTERSMLLRQKAWERGWFALHVEKSLEAYRNPIAFTLFWVIRRVIDHFPIPHNTLCLPPKFCITYCLKMLLGKCNTPRSI